MIINRASASNLKTFNWCPFRYFLVYEVNLPELKKKSKAMEIGTSVHEVLEKFAKGDKEWEKNLDLVLKRLKPWKYVSRELAMQTKCPEDILQDCRKMVMTAVNREYKPFDRKILGVESKFEMLLAPTIPVLGYIDLITEIDDNSIEIIDYKTGRPEKEGEVRKDLQPRIYDLVSTILFPKYTKRIVTLDFLKSKPVSVEYTEEERLETLQVLEDTLIQVRNTTRPTRVIDTNPYLKFKCQSWCIGLDRCNDLYKEHFPV